MRSRQWEKDELKAHARGEKPDLKAIRQEFREKTGLSRFQADRKRLGSGSS